MGTVNCAQTVLGPVAAPQLGHCQTHEHLLMRPGTPGSINPALCFSDVALSTQEVALYKQAGGQTLVDAQPVGCCRMEEGLVDIARATGVHVIASTGFHKECFYPAGHWLFQSREKQLYHVFSQELSQGLYVGSETAPPEASIPHRAGLVKIALEEEGITPANRARFAAAAAAAAQHSAPLMVHTDPGTAPLEALAFFTAQGAAPGHIIFSHLDRTCPDIETHKALCRAGCLLGYDTIARPRYHSDEAELDLLEQMLTDGWEDHILPSLDTTRQRLRAYGGTPGLDYILRTFIPKMQARGISDAQIQKMTRQNAQKILAPA